MFQGTDIFFQEMEDASHGLDTNVSNYEAVECSMVVGSISGPRFSTLSEHCYRTQKKHPPVFGPGSKIFPAGMDWMKYLVIYTNSSWYIDCFTGN